ncbi:MAG TPA: RluA family pseudouridine synthase [Candidatus Alectryocaccomicrobium excrementavium]|uniref:RNA pseudouridylate synthase n=1 Tax=Candidatus Alectryocaccomicrobium excrementavium TaxID=2840668 RepID=A0A9D1FYA0_9FIRM|nr:RluA family pseudouridine synthase [Candidatus Alectryocaccomicrobium excrementavium]
MREWTVGPEAGGKRLDRYLAARLGGVPAGALQKFLRLGKIKRNGRRANAGDRLCAGDALQLYLDDDCFEAAPPRRPDPLLSRFRPHLAVLYEDSALLLIDKKPGMLVHPDASEKVNTLVTHVRAYLYQKGEYDPESGFAPAPCNRIDRFTGGIVIFAKTKDALLAVDALIRARKLRKFYHCIVRGALRPPEGVLKNFLLKGEKRVRVLDRPEKGAQAAETRYRTLDARGGMSLVECELITGRTHQIRAQMAHAGHPLLGDGQYGDAAWNRAMGRGSQALYAIRLEFPRELTGVLAPLSGRSFALQSPLEGVLEGGK